MFKNLTLIMLVFASFGLQAINRAVYRAVICTHCARCNRCLAHKKIVIKISSRHGIKNRRKRRMRSVIRRFRVSNHDRMIIQRLNASNPAMWQKITVHRSLAHLVDPRQWTYQGECCHSVTFVPSRYCSGDIFSYPLQRSVRAIQLYDDVALDQILYGATCVKLTLRPIPCWSRLERALYAARLQRNDEFRRIYHVHVRA